MANEAIRERGEGGGGRSKIENNKTRKEWDEVQKSLDRCRGVRERSGVQDVI